MPSTPRLCIYLVGTRELAEPALVRHLRSHYDVHSMHLASDVERAVQYQAPDAIVCEQHLEDGRGVDQLHRLRFSHPYAVRLLSLQSARRDEVVRAINDAAVYEVVSPPFEPEQLALILKRALESRELARIHRYLSRELKFADQ